MSPDELEDLYRELQFLSDAIKAPQCRLMYRQVARPDLRVPSCLNMLATQTLPSCRYLGQVSGCMSRTLSRTLIRSLLVLHISIHMG